MRIKTVAIAVAMFGTTLAAPTVAQASFSQCYSSNMCAWGNNDYNWLIANQSGGQNLVDPFDDSIGENNQTDSWANRSTTYNGCLYDGQGSNPLVTMLKSNSEANMSFVVSDKTSSMKTNGAC